MGTQTTISAKEKQAQKISVRSYFMNNHHHFVPHHINADETDLAGNNGIGRYIFLPGSDGRAKLIAQHFQNLQIKPHARGHNLYLGTLVSEGHAIDVATISSGMGCPSMEIILHELFHLGAKRFLRVGTAGSLQPDFVKLGDIVNAHASVRDERTTVDYVPMSVPAIASFEFTSPILHAAKRLRMESSVKTGIVHCKSSLYARQLGAGPKSDENKDYINLLTQCGVLATEMETAALFVQSQLYNYQLLKADMTQRVLSGALLGVLSVPPNQFAPFAEIEKITDTLINLAVETIKMLGLTER